MQRRRARAFVYSRSGNRSRWPRNCVLVYKTCILVSYFPPLNVLYNQFFFTGFSCVGLGARLVVESQGEGRLLCRSPPCKVFRLYIKWSLVFKHFLCWGGGGVM